MARPTFAGLLALLVCSLIGCAFATESAAHLVSVIREKINAMHFVEQGFVHIGDDGVARSYDVDGTVLDCFALSTAEIMAVAHSMIINAKLTDSERKENREHLLAIFEGVNGHDVSENDMIHPSEDLLPYQLKGGRVLENLSDADLDTTHTKDVSKIFERQLGFCQSQWCIRSAGCFILNCGPCIGLDRSVALQACSL